MILTPLERTRLLGVVAQLRHAYLQALTTNLDTGRVRQSFADGLLAPEIRTLEALLTPSPAADPGPTTLYLSFWDLCLDNLPEGTFSRRRLTTDDARARIEDAQRLGRLACVSQADLLAPFCERERRTTEALCAMLATFGIAVSLNDFASADQGPEGDPLYCVAPLQLARVRTDAQLLVVTCNYVLARGRSDQRFDIAPESVAFHLLTQERS